MKFKIKTLFALITLVCLAITIYRYGYTNGKADLIEHQRQLKAAKLAAEKLNSQNPKNIEQEIEQFIRRANEKKERLFLERHALLHPDSPPPKFIPPEPIIIGN